jgi:hypothetical protein
MQGRARRRLISHRSGAVNKTPVAEWRDGEKDFKLDWVNPAVEWQLWITNRRKQFFKVTSDNCE